jgi:hypothetical protein
MAAAASTAIGVHPVPLLGDAGPRLLAAGGPERLRRGATGVELRRPGGWIPIGPAAWPADWPETISGAVLMWGLGDGELLLEALERSPLATLWQWVWDPAALVDLLERVDLRAPLADGRLRFVLGAAALTALPPGLPALVHPAEAAATARERAAWGRVPGAPLAAVVDGGLMVADLSDALAARGEAVWPIALGVDAGALADLAAAGAVGVYGINVPAGLAEACARVGLPLRLWEIDPCVEPPAPPRGPLGDVQLFTFRRRQVGAWSAAGFPAVGHLPLGAPDRRARPAAPDAERYGAPVAFVGESLLRVAEAHRQRALGELAAWLRRRGLPALRVQAEAGALAERALAEQRASPDRWCLDAVLDRLCPGLRAEATLRRGADPALLLGEGLAAERRLRAVARLAPFGVHVWGDEGWRRLEPVGVRVRGPAGHFHALNHIYACAAINVDIGRLYQQDIVTMRVFDVLACGGFVLAERSDELSDLFRVGEEVDDWGTIDELADKVRHYLAHPEAAARIAARGHAAVRARHRLEDRLATVIA